MTRRNGFFVVPFDFSEEAYPSVVPICIADTDSEGNPISPAWIELGVVPVADPLRKVADEVLSDCCRVSEITERAVHRLSRKHQGRLAPKPSRLVFNYAQRYAIDLRAGSRRARRNLEVQLSVAGLETVPDQSDPFADVLLRETWQRLLDALDQDGSPDLREVAVMMIKNRPAREFEDRFGESRNTLCQRFYRTARRVAAATGITW